MKINLLFKVMGNEGHAISGHIGIVAIWKDFGHIPEVNTTIKLYVASESRTNWRVQHVTINAPSMNDCDVIVELV